MKVISEARQGQGGAVNVACIKKGDRSDLGVPCDTLTAALQKCHDHVLLAVWGYPMRIV